MSTPCIKAAFAAFAAFSRPAFSIRLSPQRSLTRPCSKFGAPMAYSGLCEIIGHRSAERAVRESDDARRLRSFRRREGGARFRSAGLRYGARARQERQGLRESLRRISSFEKRSDYADVAPLERALVSANPDRLLWGTESPPSACVEAEGSQPTDIAPALPINDGRVPNFICESKPARAMRKK